MSDPTKTKTTFELYLAAAAAEKAAEKAAEQAPAKQPAEAPPAGGKPG